MYFVKSSTTATLQHWPARLVPAPRAAPAHRTPADGNRRDHIVRIPRDDEPDGNLTVIGAVGRVECAAAAIEADLASNLALQRVFEFGGLRERVDRFGVRTEGKGNDHYPIVCSVATSWTRLRSAAVTPPSR